MSGLIRAFASLNKRALAAVFLLAILSLVSLCAPLLAPYDPVQTHPEQQLAPPTTDHLLGTDFLGRDVLSRLLYGGRWTLLTAAASTGVAVVVGFSLGIFTSSGKWFGYVGDALINALLSLPGLLVALVVVTILGQGLTPIILATGLAQTPFFAQVMRGAVLTAEKAGYIEAARAIGCTRLRILTHHILPNVRGTLFAYAGVIFAYSILNSAALSFLGIGGDFGAPDWGVMLAESRNGFRAAPWVALAPGLMIAIMVICVNTLVDELSGFTRRN